MTDPTVPNANHPNASNPDAPGAPQPPSTPEPPHTPEPPRLATQRSPQAPSNVGPSLDELWAPAALQYATPAASHEPLAGERGKAPASVSMPVVAAIVAAALIGGVSGAGVGIWAVSSNQSSAVGQVAAPMTITVNDSENASRVTAIAAKAGPAVVTIHVTSGSASGTGSGVFLTDDGYLVTNAHVVSLDGASGTPTISVSTGDGRLYDGELVGIDPISDLAVVKIDGGDRTFTAIEFADSAALNVGDLAVVIGAPLGLSNTVTNGIVSALHRTITVQSSEAPDSDAPENAPESPFDFWEFNGPSRGLGQTSSSLIYLPVIQTDASINPGNSGGALLDSDGKLIGVNVAIAGTGSSASSSGSIGLGFAIPSNLVKRITTSLIETGEATHGLMGVTVMDTILDEAIVDNNILGASVQSVTPGGPAASAGLRQGDIITGFNGLPITGSIDLTAQVRAVAAGSTATVVFVRAGDTRTATLTLGALE